MNDLNAHVDLRREPPAHLRPLDENDQVTLLAIDALLNVDNRQGVRAPTTYVSPVAAGSGNAMFGGLVRP